jgi:glyoxylase-like metal-dependent hydrolase (beta-lactamase superfamily II)
VQRRQQIFDPRIGDAVPEGLGVAAEDDEAFLAHAGEMLRQGGLGELDVVGELADGGLAAFDEVAKDQQPGTAAPHIKAKTGAQVAIGEHIKDVQRIFKPVFGADDVSGEGREFDRLLRDGEVLPLGRLEIEVMHLPGHTPADVAYRVGDAVFVGDTIFMPDYGTARADFPGGDAHRLYQSVRRLLALPAETRLFMCHDYKAPGRDGYAWETTVGEARAKNVHVREGVDE